MIVQQQVCFNQKNGSHSAYRESEKGLLTAQDGIMFVLNISIKENVPVSFNIKHQSVIKYGRPQHSGHRTLFEQNSPRFTIRWTK